MILDSGESLVTIAPVVVSADVFGSLFSTCEKLKAAISQKMICLPPPVVFLMHLLETRINL